LTKGKLESPGETKIPKDVLNTLVVIQNIQFPSEDEFILEVEKNIFLLKTDRENIFIAENI